jgi:formylmethanofuran dehydrogenase subunit E
MNYDTTAKKDLYYDTIAKKEITKEQFESKKITAEEIKKMFNVKNVTVTTTNDGKIHIDCDELTDAQKNEIKVKLND